MRKQIIYITLVMLLAANGMWANGREYIRNLNEKIQLIASPAGSGVNLRSTTEYSFNKQVFDSTHFVVDDKTSGATEEVEVYGYDNGGYITTILDYGLIWDEYQLMARYSYGYNADNQNVYKSTYKAVFSLLDNSGMGGVIVDFEPNDSTAMLYYTADSIKQVHYTVSSNGKVYSWAPSDSAIVRYTTTTNADNAPSARVMFEYSPDSSRWTATSQLVYDYDACGRVTSIVESKLYEKALMAIDSIVFQYRDDSATALVWDYYRTVVYDSRNVIRSYSAYDNKTGVLYYRMKSGSGIDNKSKSKTLRAYPNPTTSGFYINSGDMQATVRIYTLQGQLMLVKKVRGKDYVSVEGLAPGTYLVKITSPQGVLNQKLIIN